MAGAVVVGAGPGLGAAIARRFAREGMPVTLVARGRDQLDQIAAALRRDGARILALQADVTDEQALRTALDRSQEEFGVPESVIYNAAIIQRDRPGELSRQQHLDAYAVNVLGAMTAATHVAPGMQARGHGSFLLTSGMPEPVALYTSLSIGKAAGRALASILDQTLRPAGVHVGVVIVYGDIAAGTEFDPDEIADEYWRLHRQPVADWELEVHYAEGRGDSSAASA